MRKRHAMDRLGTSPPLFIAYQYRVAFYREIMRRIGPQKEEGRRRAFNDQKLLSHGDTFRRLWCMELLRQQQQKTISLISPPANNNGGGCSVNYQQPEICNLTPNHAMH